MFSLHLFCELEKLEHPDKKLLDKFILQGKKLFLLLSRMNWLDGSIDVYRVKHVYDKKSFGIKRYSDHSMRKRGLTKNAFSLVFEVCKNDDFRRRSLWRRIVAAVDRREFVILAINRVVELSNGVRGIDSRLMLKAPNKYK